MFKFVCIYIFTKAKLANLKRSIYTYQMNIILPTQTYKSVTANDETSLFPSLIHWREKKMKDITYCLTTFFNYLSTPRMGFSPVKTSLDDPLSVRPVITRDMINYIIKEIFPCSSMINDDMLFEVYRVPPDISNAITTLIKEEIENRSYLIPSKVKNAENVSAELKIEPGVVQTIWTYLSKGMDSLAYLSTDDSEIRQRILTAEITTIARRNCIKNYGFNDDAENCAFQSILYIIVSLTDWLEIDEIGNNEVKTAYKIIYPQDLQHDIKPSSNRRLEEFIIEAIISKDLTPIESSVDLIITIMTDVIHIINNLNETNSKRIMSRLMSFCQPV